MNAAAEKMLGWQESELIGRSMHEMVQHHQPGGELFPSEHSPQIRVIQSGEPIDASSHFITRSGNFIPINYRSRSIVLEGVLIGALVSFQDVSTLKNAESKLRQAYDHLNETLTELNFQKHALDQHAIVSITDAAGKIIYANEKFGNISQYAVDDLIGKDHRVLNAGFHPREFFQQLWQTISSGKIWNGEIKNRRKDGTYFWVESTIVPFMDDQGKPLRFVSIRTDITARKEVDERLQDQRAFYEHISETLGEGLYVQDVNGNCTYMNSEAERLLGWSRAEFIGMPVHETIHNQTAAGIPLAGSDCPIMRDVKLYKRSRSDDQVFLRKNGTVFPVEVSSQAIMNDGVFGGVVIAFQDISLRKQNELFIRLTQERLNLSLDGSNLALWDWDITSDHIYLSDRWSVMMGGGKEEVLVTSEQFFNLLHKDDRDAARYNLASVLKGQAEFYSAEFRIRRHDGEWAWVHAHGKVVERDASGRAIRMTGTNADVTERKQAEESLYKSEVKLRTLYDSTSDAVMLIDETGYFDCNLASLKMFGCKTQQEFYAQQPADFSPGTQPGGVSSAVLAQQHIAIAMEKGSNRFEWVHRRADNGVNFDAEVLLNSMLLDGRYVLQATVRDISERKRAEETLRQAKEAAEQAVRVKGDFLANMSHEIRTPMNGIIGMTELALDTDLTQEQREYLGLVRTSADALLTVVNDILDFSKIESGKMNIEIIEFSLENMLRNTVRSLAIKAHEKNLELLLHIAQDVPDRLLGDPGRLRQVVVNLVGNAIKFTEKGEIEVSVIRIGNGSDGKDDLRFSVRDTGIGIPRDKFKIIFDSFSQADTSTTRKFGGTGLGLTISSQLVELMGGKHIELDSEVGKGSTFSFTLRMDAVSIEPLADYQHTGRVAGMPVLVVDDNATNRKLLMEILRNWKMLPTAVESGARALDELESAVRRGAPFPLALLDIQMPGMDGFELVEKIRSHPDYVGATVMMLTSEGQRGHAARCRELGVVSYLMKPVSQSELLDAIMTALGEPQQVAPLVTQHSLRESKRTLNLLLVEDNAVNQTLAIRLLEKLGHKVTLANNGLEGVTHWQAGEFDAILMDVDMPVMNGYEATSKIRDAELVRGGHVPILAMTAHAMKGDREECLSHGMDGYLSKPIDTEELWKELDNITRNLPRDEGPPPSVKQKLVVADFDKAMKLMDGSQELFDEIAQLFMADTPPHMQRIKDGLAQGNPEWVRHSAHTIKGMVSIFSAEHTTEAAARVEKAAGQQDCGEAVIELEIALNELRDVISKHCPKS
jgi:PAS domain S-box-containing protein